MKRKRKIGRLAPYLYLLPTFIVLIVVIVIPIIYVIVQSFYTTFANETVFVGLRNYRLLKTSF